MEQDGRNAEVRSLDDLTITVVHDNNPYVDGLRTAWGFSAHIATPGQSILFDTGSDGALLLENMAKLRIDPAGIDTLVLSHVHGDHAGGLVGLLGANPRVRVYLPASFPARIKDAVRGYGAAVVEVIEPQQIGANVHSTGTLGRRIKEQALSIHTRRGAILLTGCAHPGIDAIVDRSGRLHRGNLLLVMGGFHLEWALSRKVGRIITVFRERGVRYVGPTHCSGEKARAQFQRAFGPRFLDVGVGRVVTHADLP